jgi:ElaB/YqjD/DUF883 family membrane-anchored ribosome-binding protein
MPDAAGMPCAEERQYGSTRCCNEAATHACEQLQDAYSDGNTIMGFEPSASEQSSFVNDEELSPLLAWLSDPHVPASGRAAAPTRMEQLLDGLSGFVRRHPLQSVALAALTGFLAGVLAMRN